MGQFTNNVYPTRSGLVRPKEVWDELMTNAYGIDYNLKGLDEGKDSKPADKVIFAYDNTKTVHETPNGLFHGVTKVAKEKCNGCAIEHPNQRQQPCMSMTTNEKLGFYLKEALDKTDQKELMAKFSDELKSSDYPIHAVYERSTKSRIGR